MANLNEKIRTECLTLLNEVEKYLSGYPQKPNFEQLDYETDTEGNQLPNEIVDLYNLRDKLSDVVS